MNADLPLMNVVLRGVLLLGAAVLPLAAQDAADAREPRGRLAWWVYTSLPPAVENPVAVMAGSKITKLQLPARAASEPMAIPADGILRIVRQEPNPKDPAKPVYVTLAQATVPENVDQALVILIPLTQPKGNLMFQAKVQDLAAFKGGDSLYLNLTNMQVAVELGKTQLAIKPGEAKIHHPPGLDQSTNVPVRYSYYHPAREQWQMLSASTLVLRKTRREICIFSWDPRFGRVDYRGITFPVAQ